ncbi:unnamed protein product [Fasciola hepatica]|uniref:Uncharacterized protein n=1 Tax=Fasciola hepatica TaxID=6192 RepID=A0ABC9HF30_FASHE
MMYHNVEDVTFGIRSAGTPGTLSSIHLAAYLSTVESTVGDSDGLTSEFSLGVIVVDSSVNSLDADD